MHVHTLMQFAQNRMETERQRLIVLHGLATQTEQEHVSFRTDVIGFKLLPKGFISPPVENLSHLFCQFLAII